MTGTLIEIVRACGVSRVVRQRARVWYVERNGDKRVRYYGSSVGKAIACAMAEARRELAS